MAAGIRCHHRRADQHGLDQGAAEGILHLRRQQQVGAGEPGLDGIAEAHEMQPVGDAEGAGLGFQLGLQLIAVAAEDQEMHPTAELPGKLSGHREKDVRPLLSREIADKSHQPSIVAGADGLQTDSARGFAVSVVRVPRHRIGDDDGLVPHRGRQTVADEGGIAQDAVGHP